MSAKAPNPKSRCHLNHSALKDSRRGTSLASTFWVPQASPGLWLYLLYDSLVLHGRPLTRPSFTHGKGLPSESTFTGARDEGLGMFGGCYPTPYKEHLEQVGGLGVRSQLIIQHPPLAENGG